MDRWIVKEQLAHSIAKRDIAAMAGTRGPNALSIEKLESHIGADRS